MTNRTKLRLSRLTVGLAIALAAAPAFAQQTSSTLNGRIAVAEGAPLTNAEVVIIHTPSGTTSRVTTDANGRYSARGLRVGGPYTVTVTKEGYRSEVQENVFLQLGEGSNISVEMLPTTQMDTIEVTASSMSDIFSPNRMGTGTNVDSNQIASLPSSGRNIQDYIRLDPRISQVSKADGAISAGGQNTRYNLIRIDGVSASDPFGLESNNLPTERQPVSLDAIEQINIDVANYDTTIAGATGAVVNAVTRSGTNEFGGSVYYTFRDKDWVREDLEGVEFNGFESEETYGGTFGGPLIKDKLFFFVNYEQYTRDAPGVGLGDTPFGRGQITDADIARAQQIASSQYGIDIGGLGVPDGTTEIEEMAAKIDWNISDNHRAAFRYSQLEQNVVRFPGIANSSVSLSSYWYNQPKEFTSYVGELFSDWSDNFSSELKVSFREYTAIRDTFSSLPSIRVNIGNQGLLFGTEQNSHINIVDTEQTNVFGAGTLYAGDHTVKFGFDYEQNKIENFFGRNLFGVWTFASLDAFAAGRPTTYLVRTPRPGGSLADIPATFETENWGFFVQDNWAVNYNLSVMAGLRIDIPKFDREPIFNQRLLDITGLDNRETVDESLLQPRFGFNYTFDTERPTQFRGGLGLFQGASPNVWLAGPYQNTGLNFDEYDLRGNNAPNFNPQVPPAVPGTSAGTPNIVADIVEPGLRLPSILKANLAFEHELPWYGMIASAELLMTNNKEALYMDRVDRGAPTFTGQDGRLLHWNANGLNPTRVDGARGIQDGRNGAGNRANRPDGLGTAVVIRNTDEGASRQLTLGLARPMVESWAWNVAYTYTHATEYAPLTSSINNSNWQNQLIFNPNEPEAYNSRYAIKDRFTANLSFQKEFFANLKTGAAMFYEGRSGRPYSYIYFNDINGDSQSTNDLFYVPAGPGDVLFSGGAAMEAAFFDWLDQNPDLLAYRGQVAPANIGKAKFINSFDVRFTQELPGFFEDDKFELTLDVLNIGNLINKDWGLIDDFGFFSTQRVASYSGIDPATGRYVYTFTNPDSSGIQENNNDKGNTAVSRWSVMLGVRYRF